MDLHNYGGIELDMANGMDKSTVTAHWEIENHLPKQTHYYFDFLINNFVLDTHKQIKARSAKEKMADELTSSAEHNNTENFENSPLKVDLNRSKKRNKIENLSLITTQFTQNVIQVADKIQKTLSGGDADQETKISSEFPILPGSHLRLNSPALEFVKMITHILGLDKSIESDVLVLKKGLLRFLRVPEFSKEAEFQPPSLSFILPDLLCSFCHMDRDVDLLRDTHFLEDHQQRWACTCGQPYDKDLIESRLVSILENKIMRYQLQDLQCNRCKQIKAETMDSICKNCSGKFKNTVEREELQTSLITFSNIAKAHEFEWLQDTVSFYLQE